jgi:hypothetical protein
VTGGRYTPLLAAGRCAAPASLASLAGAWADQQHHAGFTVWLTLCQPGPSGFLDALVLKLQLMPLMVSLMVAAMVGQWIHWWLRGGYRPAHLVLCQVACLLGMTAGAALCIGSRNWSMADEARLLLMGATDLAVALSIAVLLIVPVLMAGQRRPTGSQQQMQSGPVPVGQG